MTPTLVLGCNDDSTPYLFATPISSATLSQWTLWDARARAFAHEPPFRTLVFASPNTRLIDPRQLGEAEARRLYQQTEFGAALIPLEPRHLEQAASEHCAAHLRFSGTHLDWHVTLGGQRVSSQTAPSGALDTWRRALNAR